MHANVLYFNVLGFELPAQTRAVQSGTCTNKTLLSKNEDNDSHLERRLRLR